MRTFGLFLVIFLTIKITVGQNNCNMECLDLSHTECKICYQKCQQNDKQTKTFNTCQQTSCKNQQCNNKVIEFLNQKQCLLKCCYNSQSELFSNESFDQCSQANDNEINRLKQEQENSFRGITKKYQILIGIVIGILMLPLACLMAYIECLWKKHCEQGCVKFIIKKYHKLKEEKQSTDTIVNKCCNIATINKMKWKSFRMVVQNDNLSQNSTQEDFNYFHKDLTCSVCKNTDVNCQTKCGHNFHILCLQNQITHDLTCPQCEAELNPLRVFCENCYKKESSFIMQVQNQNLQKMLNKLKVNCDTCSLRYNFQNNQIQ